MNAFAVPAMMVEGITPEVTADDLAAAITALRDATEARRHLESRYQLAMRLEHDAAQHCADVRSALKR